MNWPDLCSVQGTGRQFRIDPIKEPTMPLTDVLLPDAVIPALKAGSKKQALQELSEHAARLSGLPEREIFDALLQRERLGSTGIGEGVAVPHCTVAGLPSLLASLLAMPAMGAVTWV